MSGGGIKLPKLNTFGSFILQMLCMHRSDSGSIIRNYDYYNYTVTAACYNDNNYNYNVLKIIIIFVAHSYIAAYHSSLLHTPAHV